MRGIIDFFGALLFVFSIPVAGALVAVPLWKLTELAVHADALPYLYLPVGLAGVFAAYYYGKTAHRVLARLL